MSVLIKGMKMPKDCENCPMLDDNGDYPTCILTWTSQGYNWSPIGHRMRDCPIVEVPMPHGRLIDVDAVLDGLAHKLGLRSLDYLIPSERAIVSWFKDAPTIIPAEEGET